jgi:sugar phosphate isomerase/epimerase
MPAAIAVQLYSLRDALKEDFEGIIRQVAEMGYVGVETAGVYGESPAYATRLFEELGLQVCSAHVGLPLGDRKTEILETVAALRCTNVIVPWLHPDEFTSEDKIKAVCDRLNEGAAVARENGLTLAYHNHDWEFRAAESLGGKTPFEVMLSYLDPSVQFEIDTYWVKVGGSNPVQIVRECGDRAALLHIKDGPLDKEQAMLAVGTGAMNFPPIVAAGEGNTRWLIVELDRADTDMVEAVQRSYTYLTENGLAEGKK